MHKLIATLILAAVVAGCASYSERQSEEPIRQASTSKSPDEVVGCAMPILMDRLRTAVLMPDGDDRVIVIRDTMTGAAQATYTATADGRFMLRGRSGFAGTWQWVQHCI